MVEMDCGFEEVRETRLKAAAAIVNLWVWRGLAGFSANLAAGV